MMRLAHVWAVALRHIKLLLYDVNMQLTFLFWPFIDVVIWGYLGAWMQAGHDPNLQAALLSAILLWQVVNRISQSIGLSFLEELWSGSLIVLFSTPLRVCEWMAGAILYSILAAAVVIVYCLALVKCMYPVPLTLLLKNCLLFGPPLLLSGIWMGLLGLQIVLHRGKRASEFTYLVAWITAPISGVFYAREILPVWAQKIGNILPMTYAFTGLRRSILHQEDPTWYIAVAYVLSIAYCAVAIPLFVYSFKKTKQKGLARLMD